MQFDQTLNNYGYDDQNIKLWSVKHASKHNKHKIIAGPTSTIMMQWKQL